jgi:replicative DNA helicase
MSSDDIDQAIEKKWRDLKLERKLVSHIVRKDHTTVDFLSADVFTHEFYKLFFEIISEKRTIMSKSLLKTVAFKRLPDDEHESCETFIDRVYESKIRSITKKSIKVMVEELKEKYESREILNGVGKILDDVDNFDLNKAKNIIRKSLMIESGIVNADMTGDYLEDYEKRRKVIKDFQKNPDVASGILTGIKKFDNISGGIQKGELGIVVAPTGVGKTVALGNFSMNAWNYYHKNVIFFSLEMTKQQLQFRLDSRMAMVEHQRFRKFDLSKADFKKWHETIQRLRAEHNNSYEIIKMPRHCTPDQIEEEMKRWQDRKKKQLDIAFIDYLNLMHPNKMAAKGSSRDWGSQADVAYELKNIAVDFNAGYGMPIWTANQMTDSYDANAGDMIETKHLKYSRGISEVSQIIVGLTQTFDDMLESKLQMQIPKCRDFPKVAPIDLISNLDFMLLSKEKLSFKEQVFRDNRIKGLKKGA